MRFENLKENFKGIKNDIFALRVDTQGLGKRQHEPEQHETTRLEGMGTEYTGRT